MDDYFRAVRYAALLMCTITIEHSVHVPTHAVVSLLTWKNFNANLVLSREHHSLVNTAD